MNNDQIDTLVQEWHKCMNEHLPNYSRAVEIRRTLDEHNIKLMLDPNRLGGTTWRVRT
jgi:cysteinyl-tRNA synthetase